MVLPCCLSSVWKVYFFPFLIDLILIAMQPGRHTVKKLMSIPESEGSLQLPPPSLLPPAPANLLPVPEGTGEEVTRAGS